MKYFYVFLLLFACIATAHFLTIVAAHYDLGLAGVLMPHFFAGMAYYKFSKEILK